MATIDTRYVDPELVAQWREGYRTKTLTALARESGVPPFLVRKVLVAEGVEIRGVAQRPTAPDPRTPAMGLLGRTLRDLRGERKLGRAAAGIGRAAPTLTKIEQGRRCPGLVLLLDLLALYGVDDPTTMLDLVRLLALAQQEQVGTPPGKDR